jgi:hypothetical protein
MADTAVQRVEVRRVEAVQALHPVRQCGLPALDDEVVVVADLAVGVAAPAEAIDHACEQQEEEAPVVVAQEDLPSVDPA